MKYLECPDIHASKNWLETTLQCLDKIGETATKEKVDFISFPGDLHDSKFYVVDGSGYNTFRKKIKELLKICPIVAVEGTESHDGKGSYGPLEDLGLVLLRPGKVYGLFNDRGKRSIETYDSTSFIFDSAECILFGIPELSKNTINSKLSRPAEEGNADAVNLLSQYIQEFVAPMRQKYKDIPAIGLLHGTVSDTKKEHSTDIVIRSSDIVIDTDILRPANLDRWSLGHFHVPWESEVISAGYAGYPGIDSNPWGKRDFLPGFNMITIDYSLRQEAIDNDMFGYCQAEAVTRIPYGTPGRIKIAEPQSTYLPGFAYWLESEDPNAVLPEGLHPWSRITYTEQQTETRRVSKDEAEKAKSLWDLFKLTDPDVKPHLKDKVDTIPTKNKFEGFQLDARLTNISVWGSTLFGKKKMDFDLTQLSDGLNQLVGTNGNGDGKSSALAFCSFYPVVIGKDPKSGRKSAIKDFFSLPDSGIEKIGIVNGKEHRHLITIKGAHTQTPKVECYLYIDGVSQLDKATFDTMFEKCEELYGSFEDYVMTTFYEQPQQSKSQRSGLMTTGATEARNLVQNIAGIDHEADKRFALDEVALCDKEEQQLQSDISALERYSEDIGQLNIDFANKGSEIVSKNNELLEVKESGTNAKEVVADLTTRFNAAVKILDDRQNIEGQIFKAKESVRYGTTKIDTLNNSANNLKDNQDKLKQDDKNKTDWQLYKDACVVCEKVLREYQNDKLKQFNLRKEQQSIIDNAESTKRSHNKEIELISEPCVNCGYIKPDIQSQIDHLNNSITLLDESIKMSGDTIASLIDIPEPEIIEPTPPVNILLAQSNRESLQGMIDIGIRAEATIEGLQASIEKDNVLIDSYNKDLSKLIIDTEIDLLLPDAEDNLTRIRNQYTTITSDISTMEAEKKAINERWEKASLGAEELKENRKKLLTSEVNKTDWTYIAKMLNPDKIPALELDIILDSIDSEATRTIAPFLEGRYSFRTITQKQNKKNTVDKFDVLIHDSETGEEFSMFYTNPGNKAFYSDCYIKALIRKRNERQMRSYSPIIYDEADGPVNPIRVKAYYDIQEEYFKSEKVLFVSQKDISASYAQKVFNIEEMKS